MSAINFPEIFQKIDTLQAELNSLRPLAIEHTQRLRAKLNLEWNYHSNAIEGNTLTLGETRAFLYHGITARGKPFKDYLDIKGHKAAIEHIEEIVRANHPLTEADIRHLHEILLIEPYEMPALTPDGQPTKRQIHLGEYKSMPNHVRTPTGELHLFASQEETPAMMGDLIQWYRKQHEDSEAHPIAIAALFHHRFVAIHPFDDGNGRMARLLMNLVLMQSGYVPVVIRNEQRAEYLLALSQADAGELEPFITLITQLKISALKMTLRVAHGESLEEPDDLDKRLALLHQKVLNGDRPKLPRTIDNMTHLIAMLLEPFLEHLAILLPKFDQFFGRHQTAVTYIAEDNRSYPSRSTLLTAQFQEIIKLSKNMAEVQFTYKWLKFIKDQQKNFELHLKFDFRQYEFVCTLALRKNLQTPTLSGFPITLFQTDYDHEFTDAEITAKINIVSGALYQYIEDLSSHTQSKSPGSG